MRTMWMGKRLTLQVHVVLVCEREQVITLVPLDSLYIVSLGIAKDNLDTALISDPHQR